MNQTPLYIDDEDFSPPPDEVGEQIFVVATQQNGERLDVFLAAHIPALSRSQVQRIVGLGAAQINGVVAKPSAKVLSGDSVGFDMPPVRPTETMAEDIPLDIVYEDTDLLVINKQKGLVVHPAAGAPSGTLVNALLHHCTDLSGIGGEERPGIVHRLDKDTSGLMMVAKNDLSHRHLQSQIQTKTAERRYLAYIWGRPQFNEALIDAPIGRHPNDRKKMAVVEPGSDGVSRHAQTHVSVKEPNGAISLVECVLQTGRTHQIRVHCSYIGHPVVADPVYGGERKVSSEWVRDNPLRNRINEHIAGMTGQALHSHKLSFTHPRTDERLSFTVPLPPDMETLQGLLSRNK
ncbi:MAG: RluA family pseudouridine synthase [Akkermansiaceae bacterium]|nr:RluA family pseudouridine synthase [Armatimonadota bacterium]